MSSALDRVSSFHKFGHKNEDSYLPVVVVSREDMPVKVDKHSKFHVLPLRPMSPFEVCVTFQDIALPN